MPTYSYDEIRNLLRAFGNPIAYYPQIADLCDSITAGLLLSQLLYWSDKGELEDGWIYKTQKNLHKETRLNRNEQESARKRLISLGLIEEKLIGSPPVLHFKVDYEAVIAALAGNGRSLDVDQIINLYRPVLSRLSSLGFHRAKRLGLVVEQVDYCEILKRDKLVCHICSGVIPHGPGQTGLYLQFDHVIPLANSGSHTYENIKPAHAKCNINKVNLTCDDKSICCPTTNQDVEPEQINLLSDDKTYKEAKTTTKTTTKNIYKTFVLPEWVDVQTWDDFEAMRKRQKKPMTERAKELVILELDKLRNRGHPPKNVLEQSIRNCWQDVFELRDKVNGNGQQQTSKADKRSADIRQSTRRVFDAARSVLGDNHGRIQEQTKRLGTGVMDSSTNPKPG